MRIAVCLVMIPKFEDTFVHRRTGELRAVPALVNPADENALELALSIKDSDVADVVAISCGAESSGSILRKAIAMGCDHAYHLMDSRFENSDSLATARILGEALKRIEPDLVVCGSEAINGGQTGPRIAEHLGFSHVIEVIEFLAGDPPKVKRRREDAEEILELSLPALLTVPAEINVPRTPKAMQIMRAHREGVLTTWGLDDICLDASDVGENGSSLRIVETYE
ncbi:MAG: electron transfer flavoprotein subunit beta/FixA family protein [Thermoplasmata archaeon]